MVESDGFGVVGADIEGEVGREVGQQVVHEFAPDALSLALGAHADSHEVRAVRRLHMVLLLSLSQFLHVLLRWLLDEERRVADDGLGVDLLRHNDLVHARVPERFDNHA